MKSTIQVLVIEPTRAPEVREIANSLEGLRAAIGGGYLGLVRYGREAHAYVDDDGRIRTDRRPVRNALATHLCHRAGVLRPDDWIAGTFVLVGSLDRKGRRDGEEHDIPNNTVAAVLRAAADFVGVAGPEEDR